MKVLLVRLSSLGDAVLATAAVEALREDVPSAEIHVLTKPAFRDVFAGNPAVARVLAWDPRESVWSVARRVRAGRYEWVADLHANLRTRLLRAATPGQRWAVYRKGTLRRRLAVALRRPGLLDGSHVVDRYLGALASVGVPARRRLPRLCPSEVARERATSLLREAGWDGGAPLVALAPGARWPTKAWPKEHWAELLLPLGERGSFPVLLGGGDEAALCGELLQGVGGFGANLAGTTSILETTAALALASLLVTNDSAPLHLATAVGTPVVALFGPTVAGFGFYPLGPRDALLEEELPCRPCSLHGEDRCPKGHHRCLVGLSPARVLGAIEGVLR